MGCIQSKLPVENCAACVAENRENARRLEAQAPIPTASIPRQQSQRRVVTPTAPGTNSANPHRSETQAPIPIAVFFRQQTHRRVVTPASAEKERSPAPHVEIAQEEEALSVWVDPQTDQPMFVATSRICGTAAPPE